MFSLSAGNFVFNVRDFFEAGIKSLCLASFSATFFFALNYLNLYST